MDEMRVFGYCENCSDEITDKCGEYYTDDEGRVFCSIECVCEYLNITKIEI